MFEKNGSCRICGNLGKLSFEHFPPKKAWNETPIYVKNYNNFADQSSQYYNTKGKRLNQGNGGFTLCAGCNMLTGSLYAPAYIEFAKQGMYNLMYSKWFTPYPMVLSHLKIKPLNVLKQIMTMFMSAQSGQELKSDSAVLDFILNKENNFLPLDYRVFMYSTISPHHRFMGQCVLKMGEKDPIVISEISFKPFGFVLTFGYTGELEDVTEITNFKNSSYNDVKHLNLSTFYKFIPPDSVCPLLYAKTGDEAKLLYPWIIDTSKDYGYYLNGKDILENKLFAFSNKQPNLK